MDSSAPIFPIILSGGSGTRLWPMSRKMYPKQFIPLRDGLSLFQLTVARVRHVLPKARPIIVCNEEHRFMAAEQLREQQVTAADILLEPAGRNTAPAIALAAHQAIAQNPEAMLLVLSSDQLVEDTEAFGHAVHAAAAAAADGNLVTFGIRPLRAETGYGYIFAGNQLADSDQVYRVQQFVEKPDADKAQQYLESGSHYWNCGMFMLKARDYLAELSHYRNDIAESVAQAFATRSQDHDFIRVDAEKFAACPAESIDYAVLEHSEKVAMVELNSAWSDVGSWHALWESVTHDANDNGTVGDVMLRNCNGCYVHAEHRMVAAVGLNDHVIVETADAVLVTPRGQAQEVKEIVAALSQQDRDEVSIHRKVYRPWGAYESIDTGARFQVKRITVKAGERLSLQKHHHRAEHWIVVKGTARITRGDEQFLLTENESTFIPLGIRHRLENPGMIPLELIEVQSGSYLGEDDIERFDDNYGRSP